MARKVFHPQTAVREEKRQANEALGRSFCKTIAEPVTNSDSSAKRKLKLPHASGLVDLMLAIPKGSQMDTGSLRAQLAGNHPHRVITVEVSTAKSSGRRVGEVVVVDAGEGMSAVRLEDALSDIAGNKQELWDGIIGRNLFGRGLSDVMRAHSEPMVQTYDGNQLSIATGEWRSKKEGWTIELDSTDAPTRSKLKDTFLDPASTGTAVRFVIADRQRCHIPDNADILYRLANFYMLRLIASDPNVELLMRQHRASGVIEDRIQYDFPVGQVIERMSRTFEPKHAGLDTPPMKVDILLVRADGERVLRGPVLDRDARENGLLIVDELDAAYDLTFVDQDYEKADFLARVYGVVRVHGLRAALEAYLNDDAPTSPLRPDRDGFNRDHEFSRALLGFIAEQVRPVYDREKKRAEEAEKGTFSSEARKRIEDALKHLNKYFQRITELADDGPGHGAEPPPVPTDPVVFLPKQTKLISGRARQVLLLVRDDVVNDGAEVLATASEGLAVHPETEHVGNKTSARWSPHQQFFAVRFDVLCCDIGRRGKVEVLVAGKDGSTIHAELIVDDVLPEPEIAVPQTLEFRPTLATGRPSRRNNLVLYLNPAVIAPGHYVRVVIVKRTGDVQLLAPTGAPCQQVEIKLDAGQHSVPGQNVLRVLIPWRGTSWNQYAHVQASVKVGGARPLMTEAKIELDEPDTGGFFREVKYLDLGPETKAPSRLQPGTIVVNAGDPLNSMLFGKGDTEEELKRSFDQNVRQNRNAQHRLAALMVEEASFRALEQLRMDGKLHLAGDGAVTELHNQIDRYKFESAVEVHKALTRGGN